MEDKTLRRFKKMRIAVMRSPMFIEMSAVMMLGTCTLSDDVPTAYTDGRNEVYGRGFVEGLDNYELGFVIAHEAFHKMCRHLDVYKQLADKDPCIANQAMDYWINGRLVKCDPQGTLIRMPRKNGEIFGMLDSKYDGMTVKQIFDLLYKEQESGGGGGGEGEKGEGSGKPSSGKGKPSDGGGFDEHDWGAAAGMSEETKEELRKEIEQAIRQGQMAAKKAGMGSGNQLLGLDELLAHKVDWREELKEFVRATCTAKDVSSWRRANRRFLHMDIVMPTMIGESIKELVCATDASGSMFGPSPNPFQKVMAEVQGLAAMLNISKVHLIYWDGSVTGHEEYDATSFKDWKNTTTPKGGGGTDPTCVSTYLKTKGIRPDAVIVLTDGEVGGWGEWEVPVLWGIYNPRNKIIAPVGKTIHIED